MRWLLSLLAGLLCFAPAARAALASRVAVQPFEGTPGPALRAQVTRLLQRRGFRVVTSLPSVTGTSQYPGIARDRGIAAFVVADIEEHAHRHAVTFVVWHGVSGEVANRWSVSAAPKNLMKVVARNFWKRLGRSLAKAPTPRSDRLGPAPPMHIDAGSPLDEPIVSAP